jgi:hypothetical protein
MSSLSISINRVTSLETGLLHQIAMFSVSGLTMSMAFIFVGGFQILYPWY